MFHVCCVFFGGGKKYFLKFLQKFLNLQIDIKSTFNWQLRKTAREFIRLTNCDNIHSFRRENVSNLIFVKYLFQPHNNDTFEQQQEKNEKKRFKHFTTIVQ
jgi:hypothetical protein